jgi:hypothetical protein
MTAWGIAYCLLPIANCLLLIAYCLLPIAYCLLHSGNSAKISAICGKLFANQEIDLVAVSSA